MEIKWLPRAVAEWKQNGAPLGYFCSLDARRAANGFWGWLDRALKSLRRSAHALGQGKGKWRDGLDPRLLYTVDLREYSTLQENRYAPVEGIFQDHQAYGKWYAQWWARRIQDAIEQYDPDFYYTDGNSPEPFSGLRSGTGLKSDAGRRVVAHYYNRSLAKHGRVEGIAFVKFQDQNPAVGMTSEVSLPAGIKKDQPWIGENPIGDWYWDPGYSYQAINLVRSLLEYASRGGNYACAVPLTPKGELEPACVVMLKEIGAWMKINGGGIDGSTAWKTWGEGSRLPHPENPTPPRAFSCMKANSGRTRRPCRSTRRIFVSRRERTAASRPGA